MTKRQPKMFSIFAKPGAGKTTKLIEIIKRKVAAGDRAIVVDPDGAEEAWDQFKRYESITQVPDNFKGVVVVEWQEKVTFANIRNRCMARDAQGNDTKRPKWGNFMLVLDDPNTYAHPNVEDELQNLLRRKRQYGIDIWTTAHGWSECPQGFLRFIDVYILGPTSATPQERAGLLGGREVVARHQQAKNVIDGHKRQFPDTYPWTVFDRQGNPLKNA